MLKREALPLDDGDMRKRLIPLTLIMAGLLLMVMLWATGTPAQPLAAKMLSDMELRLKQRNRRLCQ